MGRFHQLRTACHSAPARTSLFKLACGSAELGVHQNSACRGFQSDRRGRRRPKPLLYRVPAIFICRPSGHLQREHAKSIRIRPAVADFEATGIPLYLGDLSEAEAKQRGPLESGGRVCRLGIQLDQLLVLLGSLLEQPERLVVAAVDAQSLDYGRRIIGPTLAERGQARRSRPGVPSATWPRE